MNRRRFLKLAALTGAGITLPCGLGRLITPVGASEGTDLAVVVGQDPAAMTRSAIDALGGISKFISRNDIVVVKPNMAWDRTPELAANSNPEVVATVVKMCIEAGAAKVKVFDRTVNDPRRCYVQSGIGPAVSKLGADLKHVDERKFRDMTINGRAMKKWPLYTEVIEADKVINVPIAKHHGLAQLTMAMKNWMGVMGGSRRRIHQNLDQSLVDLSMFLRPTLTVLDAVRILINNGPQGGALSDVRLTNTVIAGVDQVAVDSYGASLFGMKGRDLGYVRIAADSGMGVMDLSGLNIKKITL
ncbi:MAG: DUF362 domain-containing protein [Nitrospirota bacterium]|nr:MAG: DUF362 domain-containing protein [Nitrospirota bacterium]